MYGKLIDNELHSAPRSLPGDGVNVWNPTAEMYLSAGYKPVTFTTAPDNPPEGYHYEARWEEQTEDILQIWILVESPDDIDEAEAFDIIFGGAE